MRKMEFKIANVNDVVFEMTIAMRLGDWIRLAGYMKGYDVFHHQGTPLYEVLHKIREMTEKAEKSWKEEGCKPN